MSDPLGHDAAMAQAQTKAVVQNAQALGLTWTRTLATVTSSGLAVLDGDTKPIAVTSMIGLLYVGQRIYVDIVPPSGNYATGLVGRAFTQTRADKLLANTAVGNTASAAFVDYPGPQDIVLAKTLVATNVLISITGTCFASVAGGVEFGVQESGVDYPSTAVLRAVNTMLNSHTSIGGVAMIGGLSAGNHTFRLRWRATAGGTVNVDNNDGLAFSATEVSP